MMMVPKSGWPVLGQTAVNSGHVISISYSRSGNWFGNVSTREGMSIPRKSTDGAETTDRLGSAISF